MATGGVGSSTSSQNTNSSNGVGGTSNDALEGLNLDQFLQLMITELQNQDPLNPMDNNQILQQIGTMRQISSSVKLSDTLDAMTLGQNLSSASSLIGKNVKGLADDGTTVQGVVDRVTVTGGVPVLQVGNQTLQIKNLQEIDGQAVTPTT